MKPGDIIKVRLGHDVHEAEVVKENPKTVLVKVLWSKTKHRKVKPDVTGTGQMSLFGGLPGFGTKSVKVPYTARGSKIIKIPKGKIVSDKQVTDTRGRIIVPKPVVKPELPPTPAPQETVDEEVPAPEPEHEGPGLGKDETPLVEYLEDIELKDPDLAPKSVTKRLAVQTAKPDPFAELEAAIKEKGGS